MKISFLSFLLFLTSGRVFAPKQSRLFRASGQTGRSCFTQHVGCFFEDINLGADGGLYAELIKNRSFEFFKPWMGWQIRSSKASGAVNYGADLLILNRPERAETNPRYLQVTLNKTPKDSLGLTNEGFRGMGIKKDLRYDFSVLYRLQSGNAKIHLELVGEKGEIIGSGVFAPKNTGDVWQKGETSFTASATDPKAKLNIWFEGTGVLDVDMLSLFPGDTWKGRKGGLRADMVQILADLKPGFIRFPGGCIVEGHDLSVRYQWKRTIGPIEERKLVVNRWNYEFAHRPTPDYFQTFGLGFFEYFQMAEDIGAEPLPILNCGMACQFNSAEVAPLEDLAPYVQDALDLIEFANGSMATKWGKMRADLGHPAPFKLKMLGVGNENWGPQYIERLKIFQAALKREHPEIQLVCSSGIAPTGELFDYLNGELRQMKVDFIDEHYYSRPEWFLANAKRYDSYDRKSKSKVFAGEYAGQSDKTVSVLNKNNWRTALAEAAYMTGLERNADGVQMASYAPLFGHVDGWQWKPNLIWVDNLKTMPTPNYQVQKLYSNYKGSQIVPIMYKDKLPATGQDSLYASATLDKASNELIIKIVNASAKSQLAEVNIDGVKKLDGKAKLITLQHDNLEAENTMEQPGVIAPVESVIQTKGRGIEMDIKGHSFSVIRVKL
ncbi:MAG: alpha-L-arabinofuranosidase [Haliscomenobacter sp.]|nr:alpha-L-arabinofuranosidase C-terminal domain-containing protein [Haliscomenobacter sp.]MBK9490403.1 alpha-L-arabinofuranosidase [Haliscomenobacter sp.]